MVTYADMFTYSLVLIGLASLIFTVTRHKKSPPTIAVSGVSFEL